MLEAAGDLRRCHAHNRKLQQVVRAEPANFPGFRKHVIEPSPVRILAFLHVSFAGIFAFSKTVMVGESADLLLPDLPQ